jgi:copper(I)-binding protein
MLGLSAGIAVAHDYSIGAIHIDHPWAIATPNGAKAGAGYMKITNEGTQPDRLIALTSPAAGKVTLHESVREGDVVKMRTLDKGLEIKPGETVELKPEGSHVMFEGLKAPLLEAGRVQGTLVFEKAGSINVDYAIEPMGTRDHMH